MQFSFATLFPSKKREKKQEDSIRQDSLQGVLEIEELNSISFCLEGK